MKYTILITLFLLSPISLISQETGFLNREQRIQHVTTIMQSQGRSRWIKSNSPLQRARQFTAFQEQGQSTFLQRFITQDDALSLLTSDVIDTIEKSHVERSLDFYNAGLIYEREGNILRALHCFEQSEEPEAYYMRAKVLLANPQSPEDTTNARSYLETARSRGYKKARRALKRFDKYYAHLEQENTLQIEHAETDLLQQHHTILDVIPEIQEDREDLSGIITSNNQLAIKPTVHDEMKEACTASSLSNSTLRKLIRSIKDQCDHEALVTLLKEASFYKQGPFILKSILILAKNTANFVTPDDIIVLLNQYHTHVTKQDHNNQYKDQIIALIKDDTWNIIRNYSQSSTALAHANAQFLSNIGTKYQNITALEQGIIAYRALPKNDHALTIASLEGMIAQLYYENALFPQALEHFRLASEDDKEFLYNYGWLAVAHTCKCTDKEAEDLFINGLVSFLEYADLYADTCDIQHLAAIFSIVAQGRRHTVLPINLEPMPVKAVQYGIIFIQRLSALLPTVTDPVKKEYLQQLLINGITQTICSLYETNQDHKDIEPFINHLSATNVLDTAVTLYKKGYLHQAKNYFELAIQRFTSEDLEVLSIAYWYLALLSARTNGTYNTVLQYLTKVRIEHIRGLIAEDFSYELVSLLNSEIGSILQKPIEEMNISDTYTCSYFGTIVLNIPNDEYHDYQQTALKALKQSASCGDIASQYCLFMHAVQTEEKTNEYKGSLEELNTFQQMYSAFFEKKYPLYAHYSSEEILDHLEPMSALLCKYLPNPFTLFVEMLPLYNNNFERLITLCMTTKMQSLFNPFSLNTLSFNKYIPPFLTFLEERINSQKTVKDIDPDRLSCYLILWGYLKLINAPSSSHDYIASVSNSLQYWSDRISSNSGMLLFIDSIALATIIDEVDNNKNKHINNSGHKRLIRNSIDSLIEQSKKPDIRLTCQAIKARISDLKLSKITFTKFISELKNNPSLARNQSLPHLRHQCILLMIHLLNQDRLQEVEEMMSLMAVTSSEQKLLHLLQKRSKITPYSLFKAGVDIMIQSILNEVLKYKS